MDGYARKCNRFGCVHISNRVMQLHRVMVVYVQWGEFFVKRAYVTYNERGRGNFTSIVGWCLISAEVLRVGRRAEAGELESTVSPPSVGLKRFKGAPFQNHR